MFLDVPGLILPRVFIVHSVTEAPLADGVWGAEKPDHLVPLGKCLWPQAIKDKVARIYAKVGLQDPLRQKLVEPHAIVFGGRAVEGASDLSDVNWDKLVDYFTWEAAALSGDDKQAEAAQARAKAKYGGQFWHYDVYEDYTERK
jgi:hypothetical protein